MIFVLVVAQKDVMVPVLADVKEAVPALAKTQARESKSSVKAEALSVEQRPPLCDLMKGYQT